MVIVARLVCPSGHSLLVAAEDGENGRGEGLASHLHEQSKAMMYTKDMSPWCGICGAVQETWRTEVVQLPGTLQALLPRLEFAARVEEITRARLKAQGRTDDARRRAGDA